MNTLLVGAPGVGKSLTGRLFAFDRGVLTIPTAVKNVDNQGSFDFHVLPNIIRIKNALELPVVISLDDVEILLEDGISVDDQGKMSQHIDPDKRSRALSLFERLQDTHGVYLLCTLNHPDVDAAYLRRLNPVYFPLPNEAQRRYALGRLISADPFGKDYEGLLCSLVSRTDGFNYSGLSLIPQYVDNLLRKQEGNIDTETYKRAVDRGLLKASQRTSLQKLAEFDDAARKMIAGSRSE